MLGLVALALSLGVLEVGIRLGGLEVHDQLNEMRKYGSLLVRDEAGDYLRHRGPATVVLQGVTVRLNSLGMRDEEPRLPKPEATFRLLSIGDSMAFGPAVAQEEIYASRLRRLLGGAGVDVVAAGVGGWNTVEEERFLAHNVARLAPDLVVLLDVTNDNEPIPPYRRERQPPETRWEALYRDLVLRSRLFEWGAFVYRSRLAPMDWRPLRQMAQWQREREQARQLPFTAEDPGWLESRAALRRMAETARAHGASLAVLLYNLGELMPGPTALERLRELGREIGVPVFDTAPFFAGRPPATLVNHALRDPHPNAEGHALLAAGMARTLEAEAMLPTAARARH
jgi:lysophospholipase L1-like esterase